MVADPRGAFSWIHVADCARMLRLALESGVDGPVNVTAQKPTTALTIVEHLRRREGRDTSHTSALRAVLQRGQPTKDLRDVRVAALQADTTEEHVSYQPHWAYPTVMEGLQYKWQISNVEDALSE